MRLWITLLLMCILSGAILRCNANENQREEEAEENLDGNDDGENEHEEQDDGREENGNDGENGNGEEDEDGMNEEPLAAEQLTKLHAKLDANGDGKVALNEIFDYATAAEESKAKADIETLLLELDTSKDGKLSLEEHLTDFANMKAEEGPEEGLDMEREKKLETAKFNAADANGDRLLDKSELPALLFPELNDKVLDVTVRETIRMKDADKDGKLSPKEFWEAEANEEETTNFESEEEKEEFKKLDKNSDGMLDAQELLAWESGKFHMSEAMTQLIKLADANGDKHLTADELVKASAQIATSDAQFHLSEWIQANEL